MLMLKSFQELNTGEVVVIIVVTSAYGILFAFAFINFNIIS